MSSYGSPFLRLSPSFPLLFSLPSGLHIMEREWTESGFKKSMNWRFIEVICFLFIWDHITVQSSRQDPLATEQHVTKQYDWLISDRGPFHHSRSYLTFVEKFHQGFTTRYKIYRWVHFQPVCWCHTVFLRVSFNGFSFLRFELQKAVPCTFLTRQCVHFFFSFVSAVTPNILIWMKHFLSSSLQLKFFSLLF